MRKAMTFLLAGQLGGSFNLILFPSKDSVKPPLPAEPTSPAARWALGTSLLLGWLCLTCRGLSSVSPGMRGSGYRMGLTSIWTQEMDTTLPGSIKLHQHDVSVIHHLIEVVLGQHECDFWWRCPVGLGDLFDLGHNFWKKPHKTEHVKAPGSRGRWGGGGGEHGVTEQDMFDFLKSKPIYCKEIKPVNPKGNQS